MIINNIYLSLEREGLSDCHLTIFPRQYFTCNQNPIISNSSFDAIDDIVMLHIRISRFSAEESMCMCTISIGWHYRSEPQSAIWIIITIIPSFQMMHYHSTIIRYYCAVSVYVCVVCIGIIHRAANIESNCDNNKYLIYSRMRDL